MAAPSDATNNKIMVVLNYTAKMQNNLKQYSSNDLQPKLTFLYRSNISHESIIQIFREQLAFTIVEDDKRTINNKDLMNLNKLYHLAMLACIALSESVKNNKQLKVTCTILQKKCANYDQVVKEFNGLKSEMNEVITNLCLALGRNVNDNENVVHLTNICAALFARESEKQYILIENDKTKHILNKQLTNIRVKTLLFYDAILNSLDKLKDELLIKNLKISQLMDDLSSVKAENEKKNSIIQLMQERHTELKGNFLDSRSNGINENDELYEGKFLIAEQINQLEGNNNINIKDHELADLVRIFVQLVFSKAEQLEAINKHSLQSMRHENQQLLKEIDEHKKWQKHLENDNEILSAKIEDYKCVEKQLIHRENEDSSLKKDFSKIQYLYDDLLKENTRLQTLVVDHQRELSQKNIKCTDGDYLIKILQSNLTEESDKLETTKLMYIKEKEKCQRIEDQAQRVAEELMVQIHEKNSDIVSIQDECTTLRQQINSTEAEINNFKHNIITLQHALNEKNKTIRDMSKTLTEKQQYTESQFRDLLRVQSTLEQQMDAMLDDLYCCKKKIYDYENTLNGMQNTIQQQSEIRNIWISKQQCTKGGKLQLPETKLVYSSKHYNGLEQSGNVTNNLNSAHSNGMKIVLLLNSDT